MHHSKQQPYLLAIHKATLTRVAFELYIAILKKSNMLKTTSLAVACCLLLFGCKKTEDSIVTTGTPTQTQDSSYLITGITDVIFTNKDDEKSMLVALSPVSSTQERIKLSVEGTPANVSIKYDPESGIIPFTTTLNIKNNWGKGGDYTVTIKGTSESGKTKTLQMKLTLPHYSCTEYIVKKSGKYQVSAEGSSTVIDGFNIYNYNDNAMSINSLYLEDRIGKIAKSYAINAEVNCTNNEIVIKESTQAIEIDSKVYTYKISGNGIINYTDKTVKINYTVVTPESKLLKYTILSFLDI